MKKTEKPNHSIEKKKKDTMRYSILDGSAFSVMAGFGDSFLIPFALALGANEAHIGFLRSVPQLVGSLAQEAGAWLVERLRSRMPILLWSVFIQSLVWLALLAVPFILPLQVDERIFIVIVITAAYAFLTAIHQPSWISIMADIVPEKIRGKYFGERNKVTGIVGLVSVILAGYFLGLFENVFLGFALIFAIAFLGRMASVYYLSKYYDPPYRPVTLPRANGKSIFKTDFGKFLSYSGALLFAVNLAGPFFAVYMLKDLGFSYLTYAIITGADILVRLVSMPYWGILGDKLGNRTVMVGVGFLIPFVPLLWLLNQNPLYLLGVQTFSGFIWAAFDLAAFNYFLDSTTHANRARNAAHLNVVNGFAAFAGASIGGLVALGAEKIILFGLSGIPLLFLLSGVLRIIFSSFLGPRVREVKSVEPVSSRAFVFRVLAVYPIKGISHELIGFWHGAMSAEEKVARLVLRKKKVT